MPAASVTASARILRGLLPAALLLALAACGGAPREPTAIASGTDRPARAQQTHEGFNGPSPGDSGMIAPQTRPGVATAPSPPSRTAAASRPAPRAPALPVNANPRQFVGMSAGEVIGRLGQPTFRRIDRPAMVWQYRSRRCIVDVFLYREGDSDRVIEVLVRTLPGIQTVSAESCVGGLLRRQETPQQG